MGGEATMISSKASTANTKNKDRTAADPGLKLLTWQRVMPPTQLRRDKELVIGVVMCFRREEGDHRLWPRAGPSPQTGWATCLYKLCYTCPIHVRGFKLSVETDLIRCL